MFENQLQIGTGIYTLPDLSKILHLPYHKVSRWVNKYWDGDLGKEYKRKYSRDLDGSKAVNFHTMVEFYILYLLDKMLRISK